MLSRYISGSQCHCVTRSLYAGRSAPPSNTCRLLARDHAAPESTLVLTKAASLGCGRVRPLDASMLSSSPQHGVRDEDAIAVAGELALDAAHRLALALTAGEQTVAGSACFGGAADAGAGGQR